MSRGSRGSRGRGVRRRQAARPSGRANRPWHKHTPPAEPSLWPRVSPTESQSLGRLWQSVPHDTRALRGTSRAHWLDGISKMDGKF